MGNSAQGTESNSAQQVWCVHKQSTILYGLINLWELSEIDV